jgi:hypothetical protein
VRKATSKLLTASFLASVLGACGSSTPPPPPGPPPVGSVTLNVQQGMPTPLQMLDIGVQVFATEADPEEITLPGAAIFAEIRNTETHYLPVALRHTLLSSNQWGIVRVLPATDPSLDLLITGTILESTGADLLLQVRAVDSTGRLWLDKRYADIARTADYPDSIPSLRGGGITDGPDPFQDLHAAIANDLLAFRNSLTTSDLARIQEVTQLRYAADLSPEAFAPYLETDAAGQFALSRLPASNDPLLQHVADIQARHNVFIDTIDEYYEALYQDVKPRYDVWRQYSFEQVLDQRDNAERARNGEAVLGTGSFEALSQNYNRYKWSKIFEQEFVALSSGFVSETAPAVLELSRNVSGLTGPVEDLYAQWRVYLRGLYDIETQSAATAPAPLNR